MATTKRIPQANQKGFTLSGWLSNSAWIGQADLAGWTAKASLLIQPGQAVAAELNRQTATLDLARFDNVVGRVPVRLALSALTTPVPLGTYRVRWILIDPNSNELGGPPSNESTVYIFEL